jgi:hypothetical protein
MLPLNAIVESLAVIVAHYSLLGVASRLWAANGTVTPPHDSRGHVPEFWDYGRIRRCGPLVAEAGVTERASKTARPDNALFLDIIGEQRKPTRGIEPRTCSLRVSRSAI